MSQRELPKPEADLQKPATAPESFSVHARAFENEERAKQLASLVGAYIRAISRHIDLSQLDGVTIAHDYAQALLELDRGYKTSFRLTPSDSHVVGVAMTPSVVRSDKLKSHIVLNAAIVHPLEDINHEHFGVTLHTIAHECAHVEITQAFDQAFPGVLLRQSYTNARAAYRWQIILACWDEYAATTLSAGYGAKPTEGYENTFLQSLCMTKPRANDLIKAYRGHGRLDQVVGEVYGAYGDLMKFSAYHLGNLRGLGLSLPDMPRTVEALAGNWFAPYFHRLDDALKDIAKDYRNWKDQVAFEVIGDLADELLAHGGIHYEERADGRLYINIPLTIETTPVQVNK